MSHQCHTLSSNLVCFSPCALHQVNLEYLGRVVFNCDGMLYPDSLVGTDSHTTMINGLGIVGWGKGYSWDGNMLGLSQGSPFTPMDWNAPREWLVIEALLACVVLQPK